MPVPANFSTSGAQPEARSWDRPTAAARQKARGAASKDPLPACHTLSEGWLKWALDQLDEIAKLGLDWDSYGADPPSPKAIAAASDLLRTVQKVFGNYVHERLQPELVAPVPDGSIQIEWGRRPIEVEVQISPSGTLSYLYIDQRGAKREVEEVQSTSLQHLLSIIARVI